MILIIDVIFFSGGCLIDEDETFLLTGGAVRGSTVSTVSRYNINGWVEDLDNLNTGRYGHGCSQFTNKDGYKVGSHENIGQFT